MSPTKKDAKEIDPELLMKIKFQRKCRFKAIVRLVIANLYWMLEGVEQYEGDDVKLRVEQAVRGKAKKKQLLSIADKSLLNKPAEQRTDSEKKYIYRIIGGLKCFKRYPNHVKRKLAAVTYFKYYGPNRVVVQQHQMGHAMYFLVSGNVVISKLVYDGLLKQDVPVNIGEMHAGDLFGEVSLLHNIPRTATVTTTDHCEMLMLLQEDFKDVLQSSVQQQWEEIRKSMSYFTYFDSLDEVSLREGCIMAKMKSYERNELILGDGAGVANFVYFILSGQCQMIESLQMVVKRHFNKFYYTLYDPYIPTAHEQDLESKLFGIGADSSNAAFDKPNKSDLRSDIATDKPNLGDNQSNLGIDNSTTRQRKSINLSLNQSISKSPSVLKSSGGMESDQNVKDRSFLPKRQSQGITVDSEVEQQKKTDEKGSRETLLGNTNPDVSFQSVTIERDSPMSASRMGSIRFVTAAIPEKRARKIETYFMQVCLFNPGSSFGFGENMRDRRIIALTKVTALLLPKIWLLQKNTANIWTRIEHYLEKKIPKKADLFKEFVSQRRWSDFKTEMVNEVVSRSSKVNMTSLHDVPYSIRIEEMIK